MSSVSSELIVLREIWGWMSNVSGFDPLFSSIEKQLTNRVISIFPNRCPKKSLASRILNRFRKQESFSPSLCPFTEYHHELAGREVLAMARRHPKALIVLAAESQYGSVLSQAALKIRSRLVLCCHQPPSWWRLQWRDHKVLEGLHTIVCLSEEQQEYFSSVTSTPTVRIQHGVCLEHFVPPKAPQTNSRKLLFVGQYLRDFDTLRHAVEKIFKKHSDIELDCVVPHFARSSPSLFGMAKDSRIRWHAGVSFEELLSLYQNAALLFLPLLDATANNAVIEALACGVPVISTNVGGVREYVPPECGTLCSPGDAGEHANAVIEWLGDFGRRLRAAQDCRRFAERHLAWGPIAQHLVSQLITKPVGQLATTNCAQDVSSIICAPSSVGTYSRQV